MHRLPKDINFYAGLRKLRLRRAASPIAAALGFLLALSVAVMAGGGIALYTRNALILRDTKGLRAYLANENNLAAANDTIDQKNQAGRYEEYEGILEGILSEYYTLPVLSSQSFRLIAAAMPADMRATLFDFTSGTLVMELVCTKETSPAAFVNAVKGTGLFSDVVFTGYLADALTGTISFEVTGVLSEDSST